ncbi:MAG: diguanylate cyclase, partial [Paracoccaceae bacterium]|nr:diguanylate cyclase [Paracoccaceae bacterium]
MSFDPLLAAGLGLTAIFAAFCGVLALAVLQARTALRRPGLFVETPGTAEFLFDGDHLLDATPSARRLLVPGPIHGSAPWPQLLAFLEPRFPGATLRLQGLPGAGAFVLGS